MSYINEINQYCVKHAKESIKETLVYKAQTNATLNGWNLDEVEFMSLTEMFNWQECKEGFDYWMEIYKG